LNDTSEPLVAVVMYGTRQVLLKPHMVLLPYQSAKAVYKRVYLTNCPTVKWGIALAIRPDPHHHTPPLTLNASRIKQGVRLNHLDKKSTPQVYRIRLEVGFNNHMSPPQTMIHLTRVETPPPSKRPQASPALLPFRSFHIRKRQSDGLEQRRQPAQLRKGDHHPIEGDAGAVSSG
jgi:hypothetical protein